MSGSDIGCKPQTARHPAAGARPPLDGPKTSPGARARPAFTLIEVLVVVAILISLVAILLPSLQRARKQARDLMCATNLRATGAVVYYYTQANHDYYPPAGSWAERCAIYAQKFSLAKKGSNNNNLYQFIEFYLCPSDPIPHPSHNFTRIVGDEEFQLHYDMSYGLSAFLVNPPNNATSVRSGTSYALANQQQKVTTIRRPSQIVMMADAGNDGLHNVTELGWDFDDAPDYSEGLLEVHHQNGNQFQFADQHIEYRKVLDTSPREPGTMAELLTHIRQAGVPPFPYYWMPLTARERIR